MPTHMDRTLRAVGRELAAERHRRGLTQMDVSELTGGEVSYKQVGKIERGEAGQFAEAFHVAQVLGIQLSQVIAAAERAAAQEARDTEEEPPRLAQKG